MFQTPRNQIFSEKLYDSLLDDPYLVEIYENLMFNYTNLIFNTKKSNKSINLKDAISFSDILSKCRHIYDSETYVFYGQQLSVLLRILYSDNLNVKYLLGNILSNLSNFIGLQSKDMQDYVPIEVLDGVFCELEKMKLKIPSENNKMFLYEQKKVFDGLDNKYYSYSGPTSMGKSFIIQSFIKDEILRGIEKNYAIIVPTKALINEVSHNMIELLNDELKNKNYRIVNGAGDIVLQQKHNFIFILTPERLLHLILIIKKITIDFVFIDEAHKISEKGDRSVYYYQVLDKIIKKYENCKIVFASPNVPNPNVYLDVIPNIKDNEIKYLTAKYSPVNQYKFAVDLIEKKIYYNNDLLNKFVLFSTNTQINNLIDLINIIGKDKQNVVYCSAKHTAIDEAIKYAETLPNIENDNLISLSNDIKNNLHNDCYLTKLILKGVAYHVSYLPGFIRKRIESAFENGDIRTIFSTSTLVEGVNLPADNLIVMSYKNGTSNLTEVSFKNLIGRVGRIKYNLYGNIFMMITKDATKISKYESLLNSNVPHQKLSTKIEENSKYFADVVKDLMNGDIELNTIRNNNKIKYREYSTLRKFAIALIRDIATNKNTTIKKAFDIVLDDEKISRIKANFPEEKTNDDISISNDQQERLHKAIEEGLEYPIISNDDNNYETIVKFLMKIKEIFKWDKYEKTNSNRLDKSIRWYALILLWWMKGYGMNQIIRYSIEHKKNTPNSLIMNPENGKLEVFDGKNIKHINLVISETLDMIESIILFTISNYFRKISMEYKEYHNLDTLDNDWYDFVEYGTMNPLTIMLQKYGFTREVSKYLEEPSNKAKYILEEENEIKIYDCIFECDNLMVQINAQDIRLNVPELFIKKE